MRFANVNGRSALITDGGALDVEKASNGRFSSDPAKIFLAWEEFRQWAGAATGDPISFDIADLRSPSPEPTQIFAIGLNYLDHAMEAGVKEEPLTPAVFTKFRSCLSGPEPYLKLPSANVDWEVELVAVIGKPAHAVSIENGLDHVAGLAVGQDYSERLVQLEGAMPQFSFGKSFPGFGPIGPWLVSLDEFSNPNDLAISCTLNGETMQSSRTSKLIFSLPELINRLSHVCALQPGDIIFTGTPSGVGGARDPKIFLRPGDEIISRIEGIGEIRQICR
ncbi:fumarylacetoacetate hydrolase [Sphingobium jiangsuense]|uniref:2-keto-4-pentenoate hydratase/2-oxohepta-3-ene-1,7-dioic acid hydratase in catechol pathway n=1 Tax=Sphingobium jiangsuense TaxID=870476 RepID=A0A7W6BRB6_9SPHN|nr:MULTISPECIES: fumarylacetoacetate hydrolase family protein [Sphingobium]MBB3926379.1 2-keto-4-pentenoate hydratase/2-oxohepta-3-ene-1,7-dioic acid hydratase in catechol pathway [Sphingobium jiangsuense]GLS99079.1 fumarylacetoacetate hydrolase [Sphingobium jiangsuense]SCW95540.1 2-keto-4-pentenoate hydratase/2-oxohepta-3-ene-1,7-dioic acid hydratase (catechol pathway) [Sphingobium faniae]